MPTGDKAADEQSRKAANAKRRDISSNLFETDDRKERRLRKKKRQMESSGSAEKKEEAKKEASRESSKKHQEKQAPEENKKASRESSKRHREKKAPEENKKASRESEKRCREKKKRSDEEERKRNEEEAAREKAARAQADRQREARLLAKFQYRAEFWLKQSRTGYSDSLFPVVMDDVEKSVAVPAADSTVALTDEEKHILERLKGSFLFQQPLYPIETVECRGLDDEQTDHSHRHPFMTSWTAVRGLNFDMLYFRWHFGNWRLTQP